MVRGRDLATYNMETGITLDASYVSEPIHLGHADAISAQVFLYNSADAYGKLYFETKVHSQADTWHALPLADGTLYEEISGQHIDAIYDMGCLGTGLFRIKYDRSSGNGYMDLHVLKKRKS